ncbi:MAG: 2-dehydropantoate 2-reductase [Anaerolineales bacterium]
MKKVLIVGTGALATLFAARLAAAGSPVTMLGTWKNALAALNQDGARLVTAEGVEMRFPVRATDDPAGCTDIDLALVLVKSWQTQEAAQKLLDCLPASGLAVTFQNGLGNHEILAGALGEARALLGVCTYGATLLGPGLARSGGEGILSLEAHPRSGEVEGLLRGAGFRVDIVRDANALAWGKLVINAAINPLTALLRVPNGELLKRPAARRLMAALASEAAEVAAADGVNLPFADPVAAVEDVARRTAANCSSMLQDVKRGARTEIDSICGAVTRAAQKRGVPAPVNWTMWQLVSALRRA